MLSLCECEEQGVVAGGLQQGEHARIIFILTERPDGWDLHVCMSLSTISVIGGRDLHLRGLSMRLFGVSHASE